MVGETNDFIHHPRVVFALSLIVLLPIAVSSLYVSYLIHGFGWVVGSLVVRNLLFDF